MEDNKTINISVADPSALGLFGLAIVTLVASSQKLGITDGQAYVLPWAIFLGALAQLVAGVIDYKKKNVFGGLAFCAYGFFWLGMSMSWLTNLGAFGPILQANVDPHQMGFAFLGYLGLTIFLTIGSLETNKVLFIDFMLIILLFVGLATSTFTTGAIHNAMHQMAAVSELLIALVSLYGAGANVLNNHFGFTFLPVGKPFGIIKPK